MSLLEDQFKFNAYGLNPYDIVISEVEELPLKIQKEINEIEIKEINDWLTKRKREWELEHDVPI
jgi:hypothetical protein